MSHLRRRLDERLARLPAQGHPPRVRLEAAPLDHLRPMIGARPDARSPARQPRGARA